MKKMLLVMGVAAALALSACGSSPAAKKAALKSYVASLGASPNLQVTLAAKFHGAGTTTKVQKILSVLSFGMNFSSTTGSAISQSAGSVNWEITANVSGTPFIDIRDVDSNLYFKLDATQLSKIPGANLPAAEIADVQLVFGGRWFELPTSVLNSVVPRKDSAGTSAFENKALEAKVVDAITNLIVTTPSTSTHNGYTETGTLLSFAKAIQNSIPSLKHEKVPTGSADNGTYTLSVSVSGSSATGASVSITAPNGKKGNATGSLTTTFAHASTTVSTPSGATVITPAFLRQFGLGAKS